MGDRLAAGLRTLTPPTKVRILVPQPLHGHSKWVLFIHLRSHRLAVRTPAFHVGNRGSSPLGITTKTFKWRQSRKPLSKSGQGLPFFYAFPETLLVLFSQPSKQKFPENVAETMSAFRNRDGKRAPGYFKSHFPSGSLMSNVCLEWR